MMSSLLKDLAEIGMAIGSNDIKVFVQIHSNPVFLFYFFPRDRLSTVFCYQHYQHK